MLMRGGKIIRKKKNYPSMTYHFLKIILSRLFMSSTSWILLLIGGHIEALEVHFAFRLLRMRNRVNKCFEELHVQSTFHSHTSSRWKISFHSSFPESILYLLHTKFPFRNRFPQFWFLFCFTLTTHTQLLKNLKWSGWMMMRMYGVRQKPKNQKHMWNMKGASLHPLSSLSPPAYQHPLCAAAMNKHPHAFHLFPTWITAKLRELFFSSSSRFPSFFFISYKKLSKPYIILLESFSSNSVFAKKKEEERKFSFFL